MRFSGDRWRQDGIFKRASYAELTGYLLGLNAAALSGDAVTVASPSIGSTVIELEWLTFSIAAILGSIARRWPNRTAFRFHSQKKQSERIRVLDRGHVRIDKLFTNRLLPAQLLNFAQAGSGSKPGSDYGNRGDKL
jgi:hypothetical protein